MAKLKQARRVTRAQTTYGGDEMDYSSTGSDSSFVESIGNSSSGDDSDGISDDGSPDGGSDAIMDLAGFDLGQLDEGQDDDEIADIEEQISTFDLHSTNSDELDIEDDVSGEDRLYNGNRAPPEFYEKIMRGTNPTDFKRKHYSKGTLKQLENCEFFWRQFCKESLKTDDWERSCKGINFQVVYTFLWWYLNQATGRNGRAKRPLQKMSSLITFWCCFRLFFERITTKKIDRGLPQGTIGNALVSLGKRFKLNHEKRVNRSMTLADLKLQIETTLFTTSKHFRLGEMRILAVLFLLLLAPQGSRPQSILNIKFKHIDILLIRDPEAPTGPPRLTIRLRLEETKEYRGAKPVKTFLVPEIIYDPSLFLSPHVFLLAVLFRHRAFESEALNDNPHMLSTLKIHPKANELPLGFKDNLKDLPLFRRCERGLLGFQMSSSAITQSITGKWIKSIGKLLGFEHNTIAYSLRYFAGNSLDQSANISSSLRDLVMDHAPNSDTFQRHYLNRNVCADLWAIHRDQNPQKALLQQATSHGGSRDARRTFKLTSKQIEEIKRDRQYMRLTAQLEGNDLGNRMSAKRKQVGRARRNLLNRLKAAKLKEAGVEWTRQQALRDVEQQLRGDVEDFSGDGGVDQERQKLASMTDGQQKMYKALTAPLISDHEAISQRRTAAIQALVAYCHEEEPLQTKVLEARRPSPPPELSQRLSQKQQAKEIKNSVFVKFMGENNVRRCFLCVSKALLLGKTHKRFDELCRKFYSPHVLARHFVRIHMKELPQDQAFKCPTCSTRLEDLEHLRLHADRIHGISTDRRIDGKPQ